MRVLIKITGEAISSEGSSIDYNKIKWLSDIIKKIYDNNIQIGIVIGGGNLFRGKDLIKHGFKDYKSHYIGMLATTMNGIAIEEVFSSNNLPTKIFSAIEIPRLVSYFSYQQYQEAINQGKIIIFTGGTGNPYFTTDSAAALRAAETDCNLLIKATKVNGVYSDDPKKNPDAKKIEFLTYDQFLKEKYQIMDLTAIDICKQTKIPVVVLNLFDENSLYSLLIENKRIGTLIYQEDICPWL
ncbi:MAG: UMP kinase [Spirochaetota bacterium]